VKFENLFHFNEGYGHIHRHYADIDIFLQK